MAETQTVDDARTATAPRTLSAGTHHLLLVWMVLAGVIAFALYVGWDRGIVQLLFDGDKSRISWAIAVLFFGVSGYCAWRIFLISRQLDAADIIESFARDLSELNVSVNNGRILVNGSFTLPDCLLSDYLLDLQRKGQLAAVAAGAPAEGDAALFDVYESRLRSSHDIGWFLADVMIKLGLLGTIVGFVLMLGSVVNVTDFDASTMQGVLRSMSSGMGTALYTTFVGLLCSILTGAQFYLLDQGTDRALRRARHFANIHVTAGAPQ